MQNLDIKSGSTWRNLKTKTVYTVWAISTDYDGKRFVVYSTSPAPIKSEVVFPVKHTERDVIGDTYLHIDITGYIGWLTGWRNYKIRFEDFPKETPWARPLEMWYEKFEEVSE